MQRASLIGFLLALGSIAALTASPAWSGSDCVRFCLFDPTGSVKTKVTTTDVVLPSVRVTRRPDGGAVLALRLTRNGAARFHSLTRALAQRGARLRKQQAFAVRIGGRLRTRPKVDYEAYPQGLDGSNGIEIHATSVVAARTLADQIRGS